MPLPDDANAAWPPKALAAIRADLKKAAAWYSGDPTALEAAYGEGPTDDATDDQSTFWNRRRKDRGTSRLRIHSGLAGDIAQTSSNLLFGEEIGLAVDLDSPDAGEDPDGAGDAIAQVVEAVDLHSVLPEGAEVASGLGGVFLRPLWDDNGPTLAIVQPDAAVPTWRNRRLVEVTFWRRLPQRRGSKHVFRHLELWTAGSLEHALFMGDETKIGPRVPLEMHPDTEALVEDPIELPLDRMMPTWVPNMLPNRRHRGTMWGRPDTAGAEPMMQSIDEAWTSLMRDIRLGQSRIVVPHEFLDVVPTTKPGRRGGGKGLDLDREVFTGLDMDPESAERAGIQQIQFEIRADEHLRVIVEEMERVVTHAGYSPESFGLKEGGRAESGTALRIREGATYRTRAKKQRYWGPAISDTVEALTAIDAAYFDGPGAVRPRVEWPDLAVSDPGEDSLILWRLNMAAAMSIEAKVRRAQPHLADEEVAEEVERIRAEQGLAVSDPMGGLP